MNKPSSTPQNAASNVSTQAVKRARILRMLLAGEQVSQAEIARRLGLGRATVSGVVSELKEHALIEERAVGEPTARGGKPPLMLGINGDRAHVLSIWVEGAKVTCTLLSLKGELRDQEEVAISTTAKLPDDIPEIVSRSILNMKERLERFRPEAELLAAGIAISGRSHPITGEVRFSINYKMRDFPLAGKVRASTGMPVYVADYPVACAFREYWFGAASGARHFIFLRVLPFLRAVVFINGELYPGAGSLAGEIGGSLAKMGFDETECLCDLIDHDIFGEPDLTAKLAFPEALAGDAKSGSYLNAVEAFIEKMERGEMNGEMGKLARIIGQTVRNLLLYYNPELIILDGVPEKWRGDFLEAAKQALVDLHPLAPSADCRFAFTQRNADDKARAVMCMLFERMLAVDGRQDNAWLEL